MNRSLLQWIKDLNAWGVRPTSALPPLPPSPMELLRGPTTQSRGEGFFAPVTGARVPGSGTVFPGLDAPTRGFSAERVDRLSGQDFPYQDSVWKAPSQDNPNAVSQTVWL